MIRVTVWNEFRHEKASKEVAAIYPNGLHATIAEFLGKNDDIECRLACLDDPEHGLTDDVLDNTDVLIWLTICSCRSIASIPFSSRKLPMFHFFYKIFTHNNM